MGYVVVTCYYCNHKRETYIYSSDVTDIKCERCKDSNVKITPVDKSKNNVFGYEDK